MGRAAAVDWENPPKVTIDRNAAVWFEPGDEQGDQYSLKR